MKILNLSLDNHILENGSAVQRRQISLAEKAGETTVFVPGERDERRELSKHLTVYSFGGWRPYQLFKMWRKGKTLLKEENPPSRRLDHPPLRKEELKKYDLITVQDPYFLGLLGQQLSARCNVPFEIQIHGLEKFSGIRKWIAEFVLHRADKIRVVSERLLGELTKRYTLTANRFYTLPVYTQVAIPQRVVKRKTIPYPFTFLTVGRLVSVKNIGLQIRALAKVAERVPHVRLQIVGSGPEHANLELEARSLKLEASVVFEGEQKDLNRFYEEADAFLLTSDSEGWGRVVLEAAAHKLPIIMTDVGLAREVIHNEENGFIIPVGDEHELAVAMQEFLDKPDLRTRLGEAAFRTFKALPSKESQIERQVTEWEEIARQ